MSDEHDDDTDTGLPESSSNLTMLAGDIEQALGEQSTNLTAILQSLNGTRSAEGVALVELLTCQRDVVLPGLSDLASTIAAAVTDLYDAIGSMDEDSQLTPEDAQLITAPLLGLVQIMARFEVTASEEDKRLCQQIGEASAKALARIKEITLEEDEETEKDDDEEPN
jgi:hypothetical protein